MTYLQQHWPFVFIAGVFWVIGHFTKTSVFTSWRAQNQSPRWFWWWGRESMELHPVLSGALLGVLWRDPEGLGWGLEASMAYFAGAGVCSLFLWKGVNYLSDRIGGGRFTMPGESDRP